jgi:hypothetical protein
VTTGNLASLQTAIANTADAGDAVNTLQKLQLTLLGAVADANNAKSASLPWEAYTAAGVTTGNAINLSSYNDALDDVDVISSQVGTLAGLSALIGSYDKILLAANGSTPNNGIGSNPGPLTATATDYVNLGVNGLSPNPFSGDDAAVLLDNKVDLLNSAIEGKDKINVNEVPELQTLALAAQKVLAYAALASAPSAPTGTEASNWTTALEALGVTGLTPGNLNGVLAEIANSDDRGDGVDSVAKIQAFVTSNTDTTGPKVLDVSIQSATKNGTGGFSKVIDEGDVITFAVKMDEPTFVTGGAPTLGFYMGSGNSTSNNRNATYDSTSSDGKTLFFKYEVKTRGRGSAASENDFDHDGLTHIQSEINRLGASIKDSAGNDATLSYSSSPTEQQIKYRVDALVLLGTTDDLLIRGEQDSNGSWYFFFDSRSPGSGGTVPDGRVDTVDSVLRAAVNTAITGHNGATTPDFEVRLPSREELASIRTTSSNLWPTDWLPSQTFSSFFYHTNNTSSEQVIVQSTTATSVGQYGNSNIAAWAAFQVL